MPKDHPETAITIRPDETESTRPIARVTKERSVMQAVMFTFSQTKTAVKTRSELIDRAGIYFLWAEPWAGAGELDAPEPKGESDHSTLRYLYIGSSQNLKTRFATHAGNDWWQNAIAFSSANREIDGEQALYVEERLVKLAAQLGKARIKNDKWNKSSAATTTATSQILDADVGRKDVADYFYREILQTLPLLGLDALVSSETEAPEEPVSPYQQERFYLSLKEGEVSAEGEQRDDGFLVFEGAVASVETTPGFTTSYAAAALRQELMNTGVLVKDEKGFRLAKNKTFPSSSSAASVFAGSSKSGPKEWTNKSGKSLKQVLEVDLPGS